MIASYSIICSSDKTNHGIVLNAEQFQEKIKESVGIKNIILSNNFKETIDKIESEGKYLLYDNENTIKYINIAKITNEGWFKYLYDNRQYRFEIKEEKTFELYINKNEEVIHELKEENLIYEEETFNQKYCKFYENYDRYIKNYNKYLKEYSKQDVKLEQIKNFNLFEMEDYKKHSLTFIIGKNNIDKTESAVSIVDQIMEKYNIEEFYLYEKNSELIEVWDDVFSNLNIRLINERFDENIKNIIHDMKNKIIIIHIDNEKMTKSETLFSLLLCYYECNINLILILDEPHRFNKLVYHCIDYVVIQNDIEESHKKAVYNNLVKNNKLSFEEFVVNLKCNQKLFVDNENNNIYNGF